MRTALYPSGNGRGQFVDCSYSEDWLPVKYRLIRQPRFRFNWCAASALGRRTFLFRCGGTTRRRSHHRQFIRRENAEDPGHL